jgi:hypothetical protein
MRLRPLTFHGDECMRKLLLACAAVAMLGCGGGDSTGPAASAEGTWNLQSVNGQGLPFTAAFISSPLYRFEILGDQVIANADGTFTQYTTTRETVGTDVTENTDTFTGTWTQHGNQIDITDSDGVTTNAVVSGNKLAINQSGFVAVYVRQ